MLMAFRKHSYEICMVEISGDNNQSLWMFVFKITDDTVQSSLCFRSSSTGRNVNSYNVQGGELYLTTMYSTID